MKITYIGHATFLIEGNKKIIVDPFINGNPQANISLKDLRDVDYILVTHGHGDHLGDTVELARKSGATVITNFEISLYLQSKGVMNVHSMHIGGRAKFDFGRLKMFPAHHGSGIIEGSKILYGGNPAGFVIEMDGKKVYHAGDTGLMKDMELLEDEDIDVALLPIGGNYTMDVEDAVKAVKMIKPKKIVPMHYNTWPLIKADVNAFKEKVERLGVECIVLQPGNSMEL